MDWIGLWETPRAHIKQHGLRQKCGLIEATRQKYSRAVRDKGGQAHMMSI